MTRRAREPRPRRYRWRCWQRLDERRVCRVAGEEATQAEAVAKWTAHDLSEHYRPTEGAPK